MSKVTSKLQVTLPKRVADQYKIRPGQEIEFVPAGDSLRVLLPGSRVGEHSAHERREAFDRATARQRAREKLAKRLPRPRSRGWTRDELYDRGHAR